MHHFTQTKPDVVPALEAVDLSADTVTIPVRLCNLPPFHSIANQVLMLTADPDIELRKIAAVIESDPAFAAEILFLANSSLFGFPSRMHVLRHAVAILGLERIKALAMTVAMRAFLGGRNPLVRQCWRHSLACAIVCEEIAPIFDFSPDRAYTSGIIHDIGRLGLLKMYPQELGPVLTRQYQVNQEVLEAERAALQVDHGRAGVWLIKNWALPETLYEICAHHHDPPQPTDSEMLRMVKVACLLADAIGFPAVECAKRPEYLDVVSPLQGRLRRKEFPPEEDLRANVRSRQSAFDGELD